MKKMTVVTLLLLVGCAGSSAEPTSPAASPDSSWRPPSSYRFDVTSKCGERSFIGHYRITVNDGQVTSTKGLDESAQASLNHESAVPTLQDLLDEAENARASGADVVEVDTTADGRPTHIEIDYEENAIDDEACYEITRYEEK